MSGWELWDRDIGRIAAALESIAGSLEKIAERPVVRIRSLADLVTERPPQPYSQPKRRKGREPGMQPWKALGITQAAWYYREKVRKSKEAKANGGDRQP